MDQYLKQAERYYNRALKLGITVISYEHQEYPDYLNQCPDAPLVLYCKGKIQANASPGLAVVGTRSMTPYGRDFCREFIQELQRHNPIIISGLAYGVDICGQRAALKSGLQTIACLAHGLDCIYPSAHQADALAIMNQGGLISEFPPGIRPRPEYFLRRNRLIAGMAQATVVIETGDQGGSLVTADYALGYHREVFAVPGRLSDPMSAGCNRLISQQRAQLLRSAGELAVALNWKSSLQEKAPLTESIPNSEASFPAGWSRSRVAIATFLRDRQKCQIDALLIATKIPPALLNQELFLMEMEGLIQGFPGKSYSWVRKAGF
ncbi:DNA-processing protein DprA [Robiginitalea myxolifaciens]|nr:DNA-processing protein DprA [Robiginitalea myxolifaciens]